MNSKKIIIILIILFITIIVMLSFFVLSQKSTTTMASNDNQIKINDNGKIINDTKNNIDKDSNNENIITVIIDETQAMNKSNSSKNILSLRDNGQVIKKSEVILNSLKNKNRQDNNEEINIQKDEQESTEQKVTYSYSNNQTQENNQNNNKQEPEEKIDYSGYYLMVNNTANVVNVYEVDYDGNIGDCVKAFVCSTGTSTPTSGTYKTDYKYRWISLFGNVYGQYATRIVGNILFHSVPYTEKYNNSSLEYWEYDKLGTSASMGCVRLTVEDAKWIYDNCKSGTYVEFYQDENPGPLGKPETIKISDYEELRNWDPTDPDENNPWNIGV